MKKLTFLASMMSLAIIMMLSSCIKEDFDTPPVIVPKVNFASNISIMDFKAMYGGTGVDSIGEDTIIQGIVVGNDESGNIYKSLIIQDATGGLEIKLDQTGLYNQYKLGQRVFVKCKGLYLGAYGGLTQLGYLYQGSIGRIPQLYVAEHLFVDSFPGAAPIPAVKTISGLSVSDLSTLVRFDSVTFVDGGIRVFCEQTVSSADDRVLKDQSGNSILVRTSKYANFAGMTIPSGLGSVVGVLSVYNGDYQLYVRDVNDLINFVPDPNTYLLNETWATSLGAFTQNSVLGNEVWAITSYGLTMTGYTGGTYNANEDWMISPSMNLDLYNSEILKFETAMKYGTPGQGLQVLYSTNYTGTGDPNQATWNDITNLSILSQGNFVWTGSGDVDLSQISGTNVRIAFKYVSGASSSSCATWEMRNLTLKGIKN